MSLIEVLFIVVIIIVIFYIVDSILYVSSNNYYMHIDNDNDVSLANTYLYMAESRLKKSPLENYRIGNVYDFILKNPRKAHTYYVQAIRQSVNNTDDAEFIHTRLRDRENINHEAEIDDVKYDIFNLRELDNELKELEDVLQKVYETKDETIEDKIKWKSDGQNVHDTNINDEIKRQYDYIAKCNTDLYIWDINDIKNYISTTYSANANETEKQNIQPAIDTLDYICNAKANIMKLGVAERLFVSNVFTKIFNEPDDNKRKILMENFLLNLKESGGELVPVCVTGRVTRIMSSFAGADENNPELGILKSKPVIRNEILSKAADTRNKILDSCSTEQRKKYDNSCNDEETQNLETQIKYEITKRIHNDYSEMYKDDPKFIDSLLGEITSTI